MADPLATGQGVKSITVLRKIIRADGTEEEEEVVAYWDADPELMERVLNSGGALVQDDGTISPKAKHVGRVTPSDHLLNMTRDQLEGGQS